MLVTVRTCRIGRVRNQRSIGIGDGVRRIIGIGNLRIAGIGDVRRNHLARDGIDDRVVVATTIVGVRVAARTCRDGTATTFASIAVAGIRDLEQVGVRVVGLPLQVLHGNGDVSIADVDLIA